MVSTSNQRHALSCLHTGVKGTLALNTTAGLDRQRAFVQSGRKRSPCSEKWTEAVVRGSDGATKKSIFLFWLGVTQGGERVNIEARGDIVGPLVLLFFFFFLH